MIDDRFLVYITETMANLGILNVSRCENLTDVGIRSASFPSLRFLGIAHCKVGVESVICAISNRENCSMCVEGTLNREGIAHLLDLYPNIAEVGTPSLCGLPQGTVSPQALSPLCFYCRSSSLATVLTFKESSNGSWMEL